MKTILEHLSYMSILAFVLTTGSANAALRSNSTPSGRYNGSAAWDAVGQRLIGFGGTTGVSVNTVFTATSYGNTVNYATVVPAGTAPAPRNSQATCWDPDGRRLLIFGGEGAAGALGDVAVLTVTQQGMTWSAPAVAGTPPSARSGAACAWDRVGQRAFFFGGTAGVVQGDVWALDTAGGQFRWRALTAPNGPSARTHAMAVFDPVAGEMVVIGGYDGAAAVSETWVLTPRGDVGLWRRLAPVGAMPVARYAGVAEYDAAGHRVIVAMGALGNWNYTSSVQRLTLGPNPSWSAPAATGVLPTGRQLPYAGWDPVDRRLMITHGYSGVARSDGSVLTESDAGVVWTSLSTGSCETAPVAAQLTVPINDAVLATCPPTLSWTWAGGASTVGYRATVNGRALPFVSTTSRPVPGVDVIPGRNPWSVQVFGCDGAASGVSASSFMNNAAAPPAPVLNPVAALGCDASDAALSWTSAPGVTYDVTLNGQVVATGLTSGALTLPGETVYQANNAWSVTARACGQQVASAPGAFAANTAIVPQAPAISAPEANAVGYCDETFTWVAGGNPGGTRYRLDVIDAATGAVARSVTTRATTYTPSGAARLVTGRYRAQVTALNCLGASAAGGLRAFSVNNTPPVPLQVTPEFDAWGAAATAFTWGHAGAERDVRFDLLVDGAVVAADLAVAAAGERTTYILPAALPHGAHTWQVQAEGCFGESSNSGIPRAFRADANPPSAFALTSPADGGWTRGDAPIPLTFTESSETALEGIGDVTCTARVDGEVVGTARPPVNVIDARAGRLQSFGFEAPTPEFVSGGFANEWGRTNSVARTGQYSMAVAVDGTYTNNASSTLTTVESHTILQADALRFYVRGSVENGYDSLEVQLGTDATGFVTAAVIGNDYPVWTLMTPPLGQFIGRTVQIRFRFVSDGSVTDVGYRIDDLTIGNALPLTDGQHTWGVTCTDGAGNVRVSTPRVVRARHRHGEPDRPRPSLAERKRIRQRGATDVHLVGGDGRAVRRRRIRSVDQRRAGLGGGAAPGGAADVHGAAGPRRGGVPFLRPDCGQSRGTSRHGGAPVHGGPHAARATGGRRAGRTLGRRRGPPILLDGRGGQPLGCLRLSPLGGRRRGVRPHLGARCTARGGRLCRRSQLPARRRTHLGGGVDRLCRQRLGADGPRRVRPRDRAAGALHGHGAAERNDGQHVPPALLLERNLGRGLGCRSL
jgi:hypothetical protein